MDWRRKEMGKKKREHLLFDQTRKLKKSIPFLKSIGAEKTRRILQFELVKMHACI